MTSPNSKCVFDAIKNFGGKFHNYPWCINPLNKMEGTTQDPASHGLELTAAYVGAIFSYANNMLCDGTGSPALKEACGQTLGNQYVLKLDQQCKEVTDNGVITGEKKYLHTYIDNITVNGGILTGGAPLNDCDGVIPSALSSAGKISPAGILNAFSGSTEPYCKKVNMKCHLIDNEEGGVVNGICKGNTYLPGCSGYNGSGDIHISVNELKNLRRQGIKDNNGATLPDDNVDMSTEPADTFQNLNSANYYSKLDSLFKEDDLSKFYIASISIIFLIIIFKIVNKK